MSLFGNKLNDGIFTYSDNLTTLDNRYVNEGDEKEVDLNNYARKDQTNTFTESNNFMQMQNFLNGVNLVSTQINNLTTAQNPGQAIEFQQYTNGMANKSDIDHTHDDRYYTETETDALLLLKSNTGHTNDDRYYTETESDALLLLKSNTGHTHDDRYYTETESDALLLLLKSDTSHNHNSLYIKLDSSNINASLNLASLYKIINCIDPTSAQDVA